jgi:hypothetical protein
MTRPAWPLALPVAGAPGPLTLPARGESAGVRGVHLALLALALSLALAGCGKKNMPSPPPGEPVTYPRTYPSE